MNKKDNKKKRKSKKINRIVILIVLTILILLLNKKIGNSKTDKQLDNHNISITKIEKENKEKTMGWNLQLVNFENRLPENYNIPLENLDEYRSFDSRAIKYLKELLNDIRKDGIGDLWVQSSYRSIEEQKEVYNTKLQEYIRKGKSEEEAKKITEEMINRPGYSEHSLGLAVDFNYVKEDFETTSSYKWLKENAENYGFVLRYPKDKEKITKVNYEPWHWRYVGKEHAQKMNKFNLCLEEYIEFLNK